MAFLKLGTPNGLILRSDAASMVTNTTTETTIISYPVTGGSLNMNNRLKGTLFFTLSTLAIVPGSLTIRIKYGAAVVTLGGGSVALLGGASNAPFVINFRLSNKGDTASQYLYGQIQQQSGGLSLGSAIVQNAAWPTIDSTTDQTFSITAQFSVANAANILTLQDGEAELS